jgi:fructose-bisphosphate aldolase, class II
MSLVAFNELMVEAEQGEYAVGYFESWNLESLLAVADAAEATRSPVLLGFSGIYLTHPRRRRPDPLGAYAALGLEVCRNLSVPSALVFNETPSLASARRAVDLGFSLVMYSEAGLSQERLDGRVRSLLEGAHQSGVAVEAELYSLPGVGGVLKGPLVDARLSDPDAPRKFVERTGVDAFAVNIGQMHFHGRQQSRLELGRLEEIKRQVAVPLVLHGATSVPQDDLKNAVRLGIRKINVGSRLKQVYFDTVRAVCATMPNDYNPYEVVGSGLPADVLMTGRVELQKTVEEYMVLFGSAGHG